MSNQDRSFSTESLEAIINSTSDLIWCVDSERFGLLEFNRGLSDYFMTHLGLRIQKGYRPEELLPTIEYAERWNGMYRRTLREGSYTTDYTVFAGTLQLELCFNLLRRDGVVFGISVFGKDVTERRHVEEALKTSEARYRSLFEGIFEGMFRSSMTGRIMEANTALARILGYDSAEDVVTTVADSAHQLWASPEQRELFLRQGEQRGIVRGYECQLVRKGGEKIWVSLNAEFVHGPDGGVVYLQGFVQEITERKRAEEDLEAAHQNMRKLAAHLLKSREEERRVVAQEIHDELGQHLAALKMDLYWLAKHLPGSSAVLGQRVNGMIALGEEAITMVQRIAADLRPRMLDDLGLAPALQQLGMDFSRRTGIACTVSASFPSRLVGGNAATALYRFTQEALANVRRHSHAHHAAVCLDLEDAELVVKIEDDGMGITPEQAEAPGSYGLIGLRERVTGLGGRLSIQGQPGKGTILTARIPVPGEGALA